MTLFPLPGQSWTHALVSFGINRLNITMFGIKLTLKVERWAESGLFHDNFSLKYHIHNSSALYGKLNQLIFAGNNRLRVTFLIKARKLRSFN